MGLYQTKFWFRSTFGRLTKHLVGVDPDLLSYLAVLVAAATGLALFAHPYEVALLPAAFFLTLLRMVLNTFDGMIAIARGKKTMLGEVVNALPDRYSDLFVMLGLALCPTTTPVLGTLATVSVLLVSYAGMLGKAMGVRWQHQGPAGKVDRLAALLVVIALQWVMRTRGLVLPGVLRDRSVFDVLLLWFIVGAQITIFNRVRGLVGEIREQERAAAEGAGGVRGTRGIVVYDSLTGNTKRVAEAVAAGAGFECVHVDRAPADLAAYDVLALGTLNVRAKPTRKIEAYLQRATLPRAISVFVTYGMPVWGPLSTRLLIRAVRQTVLSQGGIRLSARAFSCPGFHVKFKTYAGRPHARDLNRAHRFGETVSRPA